MRAGHGAAVPRRRSIIAWAGGQLVFEADDARGGVEADALVDKLSGAVGALEVVAAVVAMPARPHLLDLREAEAPSP
jgi:hypothetical protein